jgi:hypothetical protein
VGCNWSAARLACCRCSQIKLQSPYRGGYRGLRDCGRLWCVAIVCDRENGVVLLRSLEHTKLWESFSQDRVSKRGLPHAHVLFITHPDDRPRDTDDVDALVSAQIPDDEHDPLLSETVTRTMLHGHYTPDRQCFISEPFREQISMKRDCCQYIVGGMYPPRPLPKRSVALIGRFTTDMSYGTIPV